MMDFLKKQWAKLAAGCALLIAGLVIYFAGHFRANGELDFALAKRELEINTARGAELQKKLDKNHAQQVVVVGDILAEEIALAQRKAKNETLSNDDVIARLREHGLIAP